MPATGASRLAVLAALAMLLTGVEAAAAEEPAPAPSETEPPPSVIPVPEPVPDPASSPIPPRPAPGVTPAPGAPADPSTNDADKRIGVGINAVFLIPVGAFADATGPSVGPVVHFGYRVIPALELAMRAGYLFAASKDQGAGVVGRLDILPVWLFARFFVLNPYVGPYVAADVGANLYLPTREPQLPAPFGDAVTEGRWRFGANVGAGYVLSVSLPVDLRAQLMMPNLGRKEDKLNEKNHVGIGLSVGYTLQF